MSPQTQPARVVARYRDGRVLKGHTRNFDANRSMFGLALLESAPEDEPLVVRLTDLKAVFFVKSFEGDRDYDERKAFVAAFTGRRLAVRFSDGEVLVGTSFNYSPSSEGFFLFPADQSSNNDKVFVIASAVAEVVKLQPGASR